MKYLKFKKFPFFLVLLVYFCLPTVVTADDAQGLGWLYERIDIYKAIEYNKKRIQNSKSEDEKERTRALLLKNYARAIDSEQGQRKTKLILEAKEYLPEWWVPYFLLAIMKYEEYKDALLHFDNNQTETLISEAFDFAKSAKGKNGVPVNYISTCNMIIKDYEKTKQFTVYGIVNNVGQNSIDLEDDNREYSVESIPDEFIQQGLIKEGDIIEVVLKPKMALTAGNYGSSNLTIGGYNFLILKKRRKPGYILTGKIIKKVAGSFIVKSDHNENIIINISKTNYDFFNVGDTIKCRVFSNTNSYSSAGHLNLYEIDPESYQTAGIKKRKPIRRMSNP